VEQWLERARAAEKKQPTEVFEKCFQLIRLPEKRAGIELKPEKNLSATMMVVQLADSKEIHVYNHLISTNVHHSK